MTHPIDSLILQTNRDCSEFLIVEVRFKVENSDDKVSLSWHPADEYMCINNLSVYLQSSLDSNYYCKVYLAISGSLYLRLRYFLYSRNRRIPMEPWIFLLGCFISFFKHSCAHVQICSKTW